MGKQLVLMIVDDPQTEAALRHSLAGYEVATAATAAAAVKSLQQNKPALIIIDHDLKGPDGLQVFKQLNLPEPPVGVIMLAAANDIPLAVAATKQGVADFLKKPVTTEQLLAAVAKSIGLGAEVVFQPAPEAWLQGECPSLKQMYSDIRSALAKRQHLLLVGEHGIEKDKVAGFIHAHSWKKRRQLKVIDLLSFRRENLEAHFWSAVQETVSGTPAGPARAEEDLFGTLYLENIEVVEENFRQSILEFFKQRQGEVLVIIGLSDKSLVAAADFYPVTVPPLRERRADLPQLLNHYLQLFADRYNKKIGGLAPDLLAFLADYDWPGNYRELEARLESAVLAADSEIIGWQAWPLDLAALQAGATKKAVRTGRVTLEAAKRTFEKGLYRALLPKAGGDTALAARFVDLPRTVLSGRLEELGDDPAD